MSQIYPVFSDAAIILTLKEKQGQYVASLVADMVKPGGKLTNR
jgi:hypothetical protein